MTNFDLRAARKRMNILTKEGYDTQVAQKKLASSDTFAKLNESYSYGEKPSEMFLSYNNKEYDEGLREVIDLERSYKRDTQL